LSGEGALGEAGADLAAGLGVGGVVQEGFACLSLCASFGVDEGIAAVKDGERGKGFQAGGELVDAGSGGLRDAGCEAGEGLGGEVEAAAGGGEAEGWVVAG